MPRLAREVIPHNPYHITQRGNFRLDVFDSDIDKDIYLSIFQQNCKKFNIKVYAWCLMDNHVHFIVEPSNEKGLAFLFKNTAMTYSKYYNSKHGVQGKRWQDRFYSIRLETDHLYEAIRYVELNPVRAGLVTSPILFKYSSAPDRFVDQPTIPLDSFEKYFIIDDWMKYLNEPIVEELVNHFKQNKSIGRPKLIKRL